MFKTQKRLDGGIINDLKTQRSFRFSSAWRPKKSAAVLVPVIRTTPCVRRYLTIQEAKNIEIEDTGNISAVRITNQEKMPVFIRVGSLLQGKGTQSRAVNKSAIIAPGQTVEISVNCIHHSHYIDSTATFVAQSAHLAPSSVERELVTGDQGKVWAAVSGYTAAKQKLGGNGAESGQSGRSDSLVDTLNFNDRFTEMVDQLTHEIPNHEGQVGLVVFDENGVYGVEIFNSPESWKIFNDAVVEKFGEVLVRRVDERVLDIRVKDENVVQSIIRFLDVVQSGESESESRGDCETINVTGDVCCEATFLSGEFVHLTAVRHDEIQPKGSPAHGHLV